jgi:glutamine cyclotransferase
VTEDFKIDHGIQLQLSEQSFPVIWSTRENLEWYNDVSSRTRGLIIVNVLFSPSIAYKQLKKRKMDADVEMIELRTGDVYPAVALNNKDGSIVQHSIICHRRNIVTAAAMIMCLLVGFFIGSSRYQKLVDPSVDSLLEQTDHGESANNQTSDAVAIPINPDPLTNNKDEKIKKWLASVVTLQDGIRFEIVQQLKHDKASFTEGLCYANGKLYESVGLWRQSALLVLDPKTGETLERYPMDAKYFAEGLTHVQGKLIQLTYKKQDGFVYDVRNLTATPQTFKFHSTTNEGWGLTYDHNKHELIESDGSEFLHFWDPDTFKEKRKISVTRLSGAVANNINELEYWRGRVLANIWYTDILLVINPETGAVEKEYGMFFFCELQIMLFFLHLGLTYGSFTIHYLL